MPSKVKTMLNVFSSLKSFFISKAILVSCVFIKKLSFPAVKFLRFFLSLMNIFYFFPLKISHKKISLFSIKAEVIKNKEKSSPLVILYFHGGGFLMGLNWIHRRFISSLAQKVHATYYLIDYPLLPEAPFPLALDECLQFYEAIIQINNFAASQIVFIGDSAGGNLALSTLISLRNNNKVLPSGAILLSPWTDLTLSGCSLELNKAVDPIIPGHLLSPLVKAYTNNKVDATNPLVSPLLADLSGLPPILVQVGKREVLFDDSKRLADKLANSDVKVKLEVMDEGYHIHPVLFPECPKSKAVLIIIEKFIWEVSRNIAC